MLLTAADAGLMVNNLWLVLGGISGLLAVGAGAFGAHGLKDVLSEDLLGTFETAVRYQMYHALALLVVGVLWKAGSSRSLSIAGWSFTVGSVIFSGSLYLLVFTGQKWLGAITPVGGAAFLIGWGALASTGFN